MKNRYLLVLGLATLLSAAASGATAAPEIGQPAPDFTFVGEGGVLYPLSEQIGKRGVVVAWFPKAFTGG